MTKHEPRWLESDIPDDLRQVLGSANTDAAHPAQLTSLEAKLQSSLGSAWAATDPVSTTVSTTSATLSGGGASLSGTTLAITTALLLGVGGTTWYALRETTPAKQAKTPTVSISSPHVPVHVHVPVPDPAASPSPQPSAAAAAPPTPPAAISSSRKPPPPTLGLVEELRELEAIRRRVRQNPGRALSALTQHARRFPSGTLGPERELLRVDALQRLGRHEEARGAGERALQRDAGHPYAAQIRQLLAQ